MGGEGVCDVSHHVDDCHGYQIFVKISLLHHTDRPDTESERQVFLSAREMSPGVSQPGGRKEGRAGQGRVKEKKVLKKD